VPTCQLPPYSIAHLVNDTRLDAIHLPIIHSSATSLAPGRLRIVSASMRRVQDLWPYSHRQQIALWKTVQYAQYARYTGRRPHDFFQPVAILRINAIPVSTRDTAPCIDFTAASEMGLISPIVLAISLVLVRCVRQVCALHPTTAKPRPCSPARGSFNRPRSTPAG